MGSLYRVFVLSFLFLCSVSFVSAYHITDYQATYDIVENTVIVSINVKLDKPTTSFQWELPKDATAIETLSLEHEIVELSDYKKIRISGSTFSELTIKYITNIPLEISEDNFFILNLGGLEATKVNIKVNLPEQATLKYKLGAPTPSIIPTPKDVDTDGKRMFITWDQESLSQNNAILVIFKTPQDRNYLALAVLTIVALLSLIVLQQYKHKTKHPIQDNTRRSNAATEIIDESLNTTSNIEDLKKTVSQEIQTSDITRNLFDDEKKIVEILLESETKELWQKQLEIKIGYSKVKLSRKLRNLERKQIIEKIPYGNTNKIRIKNPHK